MNNRQFLSGFLNVKQPAVQILLAALTSAIIAGILLLLREFLSTQVIALILILPVGLSAGVWGLWAGIASALLSFVALNYLFTLPYYSLQVHQTQDLLGLVVFFITAVVISQILGRTRQSLGEATDRERETTLLYELSNTLAGLKDDREIAQATAERVRQVLGAEAVQLEMSEGSHSMVVSSPEGHRPALPATLVLPLQTARGLIGEIAIWRASKPFHQREGRLAQTFTNQAVLAVDRARLAEEASRLRLLEESDRLKSTLLSSVSHELRTPLATIKASVSTLLGEPALMQTEAGRELMSAMEEETDHLNQVVGNLLDMTRVESGALQPQRDWNSFREIVNTAVRAMHSQLANHQVEIDLPDDLPLVPVDFVMMERVVANLISNGVKYSPPGTTLTISAHAEPGQVLLVEVSNQGPQVEPRHLERIFEKFFRVTDASRVTGTGLGLSICKAFVEAHGGKIWAENVPHGLSFKFTLPLTLRGAFPRTPKEP